MLTEEEIAMIEALGKDEPEKEETEDTKVEIVTEKQIIYESALKEKAAKRKRIIIKSIVIAISVIAGLILLMLPYIITRSDGFVRTMAQPSMFICMLLCYLFLGVAAVAGIALVFGGLGAAISNSGSGIMGYSFVVLLLSAVIYYGLSALLIKLGYVNPFTGIPFVRPF